MRGRIRSYGARAGDHGPRSREALHRRVFVARTRNTLEQDRSPWTRYTRCMWDGAVNLIVVSFNDAFSKIER